jgi:hypothetical protein
MAKSDDLKIKNLIHTLGLKYNMSDKEIKAIVDSPHLFTKEKMIELDLKPGMTKEEFQDFKTNFGYKGLGLLYIDYKIYKKRIVQKENINNINNKRWKK